MEDDIQHRTYIFVEIANRKAVLGLRARAGARARANCVLSTLRSRMVSGTASPYTVSLVRLSQIAVVDFCHDHR